MLSKYPRDRRDAGVVERALKVLHEAMTAEHVVQTRGVALALWVLRGRCPDDWLTMFWEAAGNPHEVGRSQNMTAAYQGIVRRLRIAGYHF